MDAFLQLVLCVAQDFVAVSCGREAKLSLSLIRSRNELTNSSFATVQGNASELAGTYSVIRLQLANRLDEVKPLLLQRLHQVFASRSNVPTHPLLGSDFLQHLTVVQHCVSQEAISFAAKKVQLDRLLLAK